MQQTIFDKPLTECTELQLMARYISATGHGDDMEQMAIEVELESRVNGPDFWKQNEIDTF